MLRLDRFEVQTKVCSDPACPWAGLPAPLHLQKHNQPCAQLFIGRDGSQMLCELPAGHSPDTPHRGTVHRD